MAAEDTKAPAEAAEEVVVVAEKELPPPSAAEEQKDEEKAEKDEKSVISQSVSFKEESNMVGELPDSQKKALEELRQLVREVLEKHELTAPPPPPPKEEEKKEEEEKEKEVKQEEKEVKEEEEEKPAEATETTAVVAAEISPSVAEVKEEEVEAVVVVDEEDGAKTVEAIKETIVEVATATVKTEDSAAPPSAESAPASEPNPEPEVVLPPAEPEEVSLWGVRLLEDERSDVVLLKFLRARDYKPKEALAMIKSTVRWRKEFGVGARPDDEELGDRLKEFVFIHGIGRDGHAVCYNLYGELGKRKEVHEAAFADEEKRKRFLKWRVRFMEESIEKHIDFSPAGVSTFVQVNDLRNSPGLLKREVWAATNKALQLLQDNYPEFVAKQVFVNVPWWYLLFNRMISPFVTLRSKSKFVFATVSKTSETLFKYIGPEHVPVRYGGLSREGEHEFTTADPVTETAIKPATKHTIEFPVTESCEVVWELRVVGSEVSYGAEFVPAAENGYTLIVSKTRKLCAADDEQIVTDSFRVGEPGKIVITVDNLLSKKKKLLLYRSKTRPVILA